MKRAVGESDIIPEMVRHAGPVFEAALLRLLHRVWEEENVPRDWVNARLMTLSQGLHCGLFSPCQGRSP